jgi:predicted metal-dependent hydrolase
MPPRVVSVPKTPKESYNPDRLASSLLRAQMLHLYEALKWHMAEVQAAVAINPRRLRTEREVSEYAKKVSRILHPHVVKRSGK